VATAVGLTIVKRMTYRGDSSEEWSNRYWLTGSVPSDSTAWRTLFDALVTQEKTIYGPAHSVIRGYGYDDDTLNADSVWSVDLTVSPNTPVAGTYSEGSNIKAPGDAAVWVRWKTSRTNGGKAIYLRKYFHGAYMQASAAPDTVATTQVTALNAFGSKMRDGTFTEGRIIRSQRQVETLLGHGVSPYIGYRQLRRGRRRTPA
jgi:hypothetical protein